MAKEMMIVFLYDTIRNDEFHDPAKSVIYFHPSWVSETQKILLCGQLMGTAYFLSETLSKPKIISLQSGKFVIRTFGRFLLVVGSDRNMSEIVLEHQANFLYILIQMYHCDIDSIYKQYISREPESNFVDKIYCVMESYLPLIQLNGNIFQNDSSLKIPKSASNLYMETNQILQSFQQTEGVLGGTILYHNKVVASQLSDNLTKVFTLSDLDHLQSSEYIAAKYHIPNGVTLINAYIPVGEYAELVRSSSNSYDLFFNSSAKEIIPFQVRKKKISKDAHCAIKRDKSLIFTHIPEEGHDDGLGPMKSSYQRKSTCIRPTHLPLLSKYPGSLGITESGFNSITFDENDSFPNFIGKTSVCSTPMAANKVLPHGNVLSICATSDGFTVDEQFKQLQEHEVIKTQKLYTRYPEQNDNKSFLKKNSKQHKSHHYRYSMSSFSNYSSDTEDNHIPYEIGKKEKEIMKGNLRNRDICRTVADPAFPIFNNKGCAISYGLFKEYLDQHYNDMKKNAASKSEKQPMMDNHLSSEINETTTGGQGPPSNSTKSRQELNLPLKTIELKETEQSQSCRIFDSPNRRNKLSCLQLTPLMSKLSLLAMSDQQSSGFSSWDTTPGYNLNYPTTPFEYQVKRKKTMQFFSEQLATERPYENEKRNLLKVELFICVQQNMTVLLILQEKSCEKEHMITSLFESCVPKLTRIENNLHQVMRINVEGIDKGDGLYNFISVDSKWNVKNRYGFWSPRDLLTLNLININFRYNRKLVELILKTQDVVIYSYRCGRSEIYYQQSSIILPGLPPPQDAMGTVSLCAKRRLERDHRILLL